MSKLGPITLLALVLTAHPALAARAKRKAPPPAYADFHVEIPVSEVDVERAVAREAEAPPAAYEVSVSSWHPDHFRRPSFSSSTGPFGVQGAPLLGIARVAPLRLYGNGAGFWWRAGGSFVGLRRTGVQYVGNGTSTYYLAEETISLATLKIGAEYRPGGLWHNRVQPYLSLQLAPTYAFGSASPFETRVGGFGVPVELNAGLLFAPPFLRDLFGLGHGAFGRGAPYWVGSVDGSSMAGLGLQGFLSITL